jgi:hypothetical protein
VSTENEAYSLEMIASIALRTYDEHAGPESLRCDNLGLGNP